jgi:tetratricopeptide (TPR) repeat protein
MMQVGQPAFQALLDDLQPGNRSLGAAAQALAAWGDPRAVEPLIETMLHRRVSRRARLDVIKALGAFRDPRAFKALTRASSDPHPAVRLQAAWALAEYGDPDLIPLVTHALSEPGDQRGQKELPRVLARLQEARCEREAGARASHAQALVQAEAAYFSDAAACAVAYCERGLLRARLKSYAQAIQDYQRALKLDPVQAQVYYSRGLAYASQQDHAQAIEDYDQAIELNLQESQVYHSRGLAQAELQNYARAIADYDQALQLQESAMLYHNRGLAHARLGAYRQAIKDLKRAIKLNPRFAQTHYYNLARVYALAGKLKQAYKWLKKVIELDRGYARLAWSDEDFKALRGDERFRKLVGLGEYYEIFPGASVGPFRLGMTRQEAQQVIELERARGIRFPLQDASATSSAAGSPTPGVYLHYDAEGHCCKIDTIFGYVPAPPVFTWAGRIVNGMTDDEAASILQSMEASVQTSYAALASTAGLRAVKWEASDERIMSIVISQAEDL